MFDPGGANVQRESGKAKFFRLSGVGSRGQQSKQRRPDFPLPRHFLQLFWGNTEAFPGQLGDKIPPACPRSSLGSPPSGTSPEHLLGKASRRHLEQMPELPQQAPLDVEEQRLYSELFLTDRAPHPISKGAPSHPAEKAHFGRLYPGFCPFGHDHRHGRTWAVTRRGRTWADPAVQEARVDQTVQVARGVPAIQGTMGVQPPWSYQGPYFLGDSYGVVGWNRQRLRNVT
ncbi:hypothetical protein PO909_029204 [Leuciscus waleckii]